MKINAKGIAITKKSLTLLRKILPQNRLTIVRDMVESDIFSRLKDGDLAAFESLYKTDYAVLCKLAKTITHSHELAEEIVDDLFFYLWDNHGQLQVESLQAYLFRSIRNNSEKACRSLAFRKGRVTDSIDNTLLCLHEYLSDPEQPLGWLLEEEMKNTAKKAVDELPTECRQVFELSRYEGKKYSEIAQELGISVNTVKYHIKNAIKTLSSRLPADVVGVLLFVVVWW